MSDTAPTSQAHGNEDVPHSRVCGDTERGPQSENLRLRMEALDHLPADEQALVIAMIEGALLRHHARQINAS